MAMGLYVDVWSGTATIWTGHGLARPGSGPTRVWFGQGLVLPLAGWPGQGLASPSSGLACMAMGLSGNGWSGPSTFWTGHDLTRRGSGPATVWSSHRLAGLAKV
jgi:hypothetical protein